MSKIEYVQIDKMSKDELKCLFKHVVKEGHCKSIEEAEQVYDKNVFPWIKNNQVVKCQKGWFFHNNESFVAGGYGGNCARNKNVVKTFFSPNKNYNGRVGQFNLNTKKITEAS